MESLFKSIAVGVFVGVVGSIFLNIFSEHIPEQNEALVFAFFAGIAIILIDLSRKKQKSK